MKRVKDKIPHCQECLAGEHDNYNDNVQLVRVKDPDTGETIVSGYICKDHAISFEIHLGYEIIGWENKS